MFACRVSVIAPTRAIKNGFWNYRLHGLRRSAEPLLRQGKALRPGEALFARLWYLAQIRLQEFIGEFPCVYGDFFWLTAAGDAHARLYILKWLTNTGKGSTGVPCHQCFLGPNLKIARCRCGVLAGAFPVVPTYPITWPRRTTTPSCTPSA